MSELVRQVENSIASHELLGRGDAVLVAVSGGVDSMVLLHVLHTLSSRYDWKITVAHFNHLLRGVHAERDQQFVEATAQKLGLRFESASADVRKFAREQKLSMEMAARRLRHDFLARATRGLGIGHVALAHHAGDQVELFLLRLLRGAGAAGLGGMPWRAPSPADNDVTLVRPLLDVRKEQLIAFAGEQRIRFRTDATNRSLEPLRNRVRHHLLPLLRKKYQPAIDTVLLREMELLRDDAGFLLTEARRWRRGKRKDFDSLSPALQRQVLQLEARDLGLPLDFATLEKLRRERDTWVSMGRNLVGRRNSAGQLETRPVQAVFHPSDSLLVEVSEAGRAEFAGVQFSWRQRRGRSVPASQSGREFFDVKRVGASITLRHWQPGDRFQPIGFPAPTKLQDLFVNQKIPQTVRHKLVVAADAAGEIFWVEGLRISEKYKVGPGTKLRLEWKWLRNRRLQPPEADDTFRRTFHNNA